MMSAHVGAGATVFIQCRSVSHQYLHLIGGRGNYFVFTQLAAGLVSTHVTLRRQICLL